ncbi:MAG: hypothetical protein Q8O72_05455 [Bacteroidales bacterium]|nr:hypothetical protein [Bacteroidales bacterium]
MNLKKITIIAATLLIFVFAGCKKDSNDPAILGQFTYLNKTYNLTHGVNVGYSSTVDSIYGIDLILMSSGLQIVNSGDTASLVTGRGDVIGVTLYSTSVNILEPGEYTCSDTIVAGQFGNGFLIVNYEPSTQTADNQATVKSGTVSIAKEEDIFDITMNMVSDEGKTITGNYKGSLTYYSGAATKAVLVK